MNNRLKKSPMDNNGSKPGASNTPLNLWGNKSATQALDWSSVTARLVTCALSAASAADCALMFGVAQGGRGVVLTLFSGSQRVKAYSGSVEELEQQLLELVESLSSTSEDLLTAFGLPTD